MIKIDGLSKQFGELQVLKNINTQITKGECIAIIGQSGSGKSVFLRSIAMLEKPDCGNIFINGIDITKKEVDINKIREKMGMVYQGFHLFSHLNVLDNITLAPRRIKKQDKNTAEKKAMELLSMVGLTFKAKSYPHELSGGQQQRIAIARCLAMEPEIMLFDEPTSALDPTMICEVLSIIRKLTKMGLTMLIVTHEMQFARDVADRVFYFDECGIYEEGSAVDIFDNPKKDKTQAFIRKLKIFNYKINSKNFDIVEMNAHIEVFCQKYNIDAKQVFNIQLMLEELIMEIFNQCYISVQPDMEFSIECSDETDEISIYLSYVSDNFNPFNNVGMTVDNMSMDSNMDNLGMLLVRKISKKYEHIFENGRNKITIKF
jgi:polar amino acid transport system ATP-binding protein